jgi:AcrR family transcriptional regulator
VSRSPTELPVPSSRAESKAQTRQALLRAALSLTATNAFDSISLRQVTKAAGITPTAFYRHFADMEELGLVLVEESFSSLRTMLREVRDNRVLDDNMIARSIVVVMNHVHSRASHFRFIARERYGGVRVLRRSIRHEIQLIIEELTIDMSLIPTVDEWELSDRRMLASVLVESIVHMVAELLDADAHEEQEIVGRTEQQLRLTILGVPQWRTSRT